MTISWCRGKFRVKLTGKEPGVIWQLHCFYQCLVKRQTANHQTRLFNLRKQVIVDLITVAVALLNLFAAIDFVSF